MAGGQPQTRSEVSDGAAIGGNGVSVQTAVAVCHNHNNIHDNNLNTTVVEVSSTF